jgi:hypothetical protein
LIAAMLMGIRSEAEVEMIRGRLKLEIHFK